MNDPVGMRWHRGAWHLFFQWSPAEDGSAMGWGHATSVDRLRWTAQPPVLAADASGLAWSGSTVVGPDGRLVGVHTRHDPATGLEQQAAAVETDDGLWAPIPLAAGAARAGWRDPFVFAVGDGWRMLLAEPVGWDPAPGARSGIALYRSDDLAAWDRLARLPVEAEPGVLMEMPALCRLAPDRWLLAVGMVDRRGAGAPCRTWGWLGRFDGMAFVPDDAGMALDHGPDFYAAGPWGGLADGRCELTAWLNSWHSARRVPGAGWAGGAHSLPRRVALADGRLVQHPAVDPAADASDTRHRLGAGDARALPDAARITLSVAPGASVTIACGAAMLRMEAGADGIAFARSTRADVPELAGVWHMPWRGADLLLFLDRCSIEVFGVDGFATASFLMPFAGAPDLRVVTGSAGVRLAPVGQGTK